MAIEGPLRELALSDVLQLLDLSRKSGTLSVWREGQERPATLLLEQGALVGARGHDHTRRIGELLLLGGKVSQAQVDRAVAAQRQHPGRRLGALLVEQGAVSAADLSRQLRFQVEELVYDLARWTDGLFRFEEGVPQQEVEIAIRIPTESVLMEAARRTDEWSELASAAPDTDLVPRLVEAGSDATLLDLEPLEWEILAGVDGERTLRAVAREVGRGEFEVAKAVFSLVAAGVVELGGRRRGGAAGAAPADARARDPELAAAEAALADGRMEVAERLARDLARRGDRPDALALLGRILAARRRWPEAAQALELAVQQDPLLAPAYFDLGIAAAGCARFDRAQEALDTFLRLGDGADGRRGAAERTLQAVVTLRRALTEVAA